MTKPLDPKEVYAKLKARVEENKFPIETIYFELANKLFPGDKEIMPRIIARLANPEQASKTAKQIGDAIQKKFKGKPVGEAIGRFLGNVQIGRHGGGGEGDATPPPSQKQSGKGKTPQTEPAPQAGETEQGDSNEPDDPDLDRILR